MQLTINVDDSTVEELKKEFHTSDIKDALNSLLVRFKNKNEFKIASDIKQALNEVENGESLSLDEFKKAIA